MNCDLLFNVTVHFVVVHIALESINKIFQARETSDVTNLHVFGLMNIHATPTLGHSLYDLGERPKTRSMLYSMYLLYILQYIV